MQIDYDGLEAVKPTFEYVLGEGPLAVIAGADTTATALSSVFYYLLRDPSKFKRLRGEVDSFFPRDEGDPFDSARLASMPYLNAVMYVLQVPSS